MFEASFRTIGDESRVVKQLFTSRSGYHPLHMTVTCTTLIRCSFGLQIWAEGMLYLVSCFFSQSHVFQALFYFQLYYHIRKALRAELIFSLALGLMACVGDLLCLGPSLETFSKTWGNSLSQTQNWYGSMQSY